MALPVALQLYSVRETAEKDFAGTLRAVKAMGYDGVEFAGLYGHTPEYVKGLCEGIGLVPISAHININEMIADPEKTYVVEFIDNKLVAEEKTGNKQIMTNFYVNLPELTEHADGTERYAILQENYDEGSTLVGMRDLMARVRFSNAYRYTTYPTWDSETMPQSVLKNPDSEEYKTYAAAVDAVRKDYWIRILTDDRNPADKKFWHTTHNSVYDIEKKMIRLTVQEDYSHYYDFSL